MKIGYDAKRLYSNFTGLGNYSRTLVKNFQNQFPENDYYLYTTKVVNDPETEQFSNSKNFITRISTAIFKSRWRSYAISKQLQKDNIDLYHGLSHEIPFTLKKMGIKSVVTIHDLIFKIYPETYKTVDRKIYEKKFKYSCENADRIVAISESTKQDIIKYYNINPNKIDVVYQSCDPIYFTPISEKDTTEVANKYQLPSKFLLSVGSIIERKNIKVIIESYAHLAPENRIPVVIVGNGKEYKTEMKALIQSLKLEPHFNWIDNVKSTQDLKAMYHLAFALIYPSIYEGFGLPVAEALLCKTPVITSNVSSLPEAGGPSTLYIDPTNPQELAEKITLLVNDDDLRQKMINSGYEYATNHFLGEQSAKKLMNSYIKTHSA